MRDGPASRRPIFLCAEPERAAWRENPFVPPGSQNLANQSVMRAGAEAGLLSLLKLRWNPATTQSLHPYCGLPPTCPAGHLRVGLCLTYDGVPAPIFGRTRPRRVAWTLRRF